jgi:predicted outer membrane repeat protein
LILFRNSVLSFSRVSSKVFGGGVYGGNFEI